MSATKLYQAGEFARLAGVTVRTLHHYDRLGLLKPSGRTQAGYRLYSTSDLVRLEQIVTLKFIGFPLKRIKEILNRKPCDLPSELRLQREALGEKRRHLDLAIRAIENAERAVQSQKSGKDPDWEAFRRVIEVIEMTTNMEWTKKYYTEEQLTKLASRWSPEVQAKAERDWAELIKDVEAAIARGEDPFSPKAQALAKRWRTLIEAFTGGDQGIEKGLRKLYADQANWPGSFKKPYSDEVGAFLCEAGKGKR